MPLKVFSCTEDTIASPRMHTASEIVVSILADEWPLSVKGLHSRMKRLYAKNVSFQACHKAVRKLETEGVLFRADNQNGYYRINHEWLDGIEKFAGNVKRSYYEAEVNLKGIP